MILFRMILLRGFSHVRLLQNQLHRLFFLRQALLAEICLGLHPQEVRNFNPNKK